VFGLIGRLAAITALALVARAPSLAQTNGGPPAVEDFFRKPQYGSAVLSPNGHYLAVVVPVGQHRGFGIIDLDTRKAGQPMSVGDTDVLRVTWQTDDRLIVYSGNLQQVVSEPATEAGILAVNRDGSDVRHLAQYDYRSVGAPQVHRSFERPWTVDVLRVVPDSTEVLLTARERDIDSLDLYKFDTSTGTKTLLSFESPGSVTRWVVDFDGVPRAVVSNSVTGDTSAWYVRKGAHDPWTKVEEAKLGRLHSTPLLFDPGGKILYVAARRKGEDRSAIYEYDVVAGRWGNAVIRHPERDVQAGNATFVFDVRKRKLLGLRYANDRPSVEWFDPEWARIQKSVDAALPDSVKIGRASCRERV